MKLGRTGSLSLWLSLGLAALLLAGYFGFHALFVKVGRSVETPFSGPAARNDFYLLQRYLEARGLTVRMVRGWPQPLSPETLVLWFADNDVPDDARAFLSAGGQLWSFRDPDDEVSAYAWSPTDWSDIDAGRGAADAPEAIEGLVEPDSLQSAAPGEAEPSPTSDTAPPGADTDADDDEDDAYDEDYCVDGCLEAAQFHYGMGCLTLVRRFGLENEQVALGETPARIDALLKCPRRPSVVLMVTSVGSPWFGELLVEHAPHALLAFAVLLALSLWRAGTHFGPKEPPRIPERRQLLEHISAVGMLAGRVSLTPMLAAARAQLRRQLLKRVPQAASLSGEALVDAVAAATEAPKRDVQRALLDEPGGGSHEALAIARAMQALWRKT